jgi:SagB-type dehydrogenase family enzyme
MIQTNPAVRLNVPTSLTDGKWLADDFLTRRRFVLSPAAALMAILCMRARIRGAAIETVSQQAGLSKRATASLLEMMESRELIMAVEDVQHEGRLCWFQNIRAQWGGRNWPEAAEYHLATFDYPALDYAVNGRDIDTETMRAYTATEPDVNRYKVYDQAVCIPLASPTESLVDVPLAGALSPSGPWTPLTFDKLSAILSMAFAEVSTFTPRRWLAAPVQHRTSPSGGARHPTEGYLLALGVEGLPPGVYHVGASPPRLELLEDTTPEHDQLRALFPGSYPRARFPVQALVIMTCVFERNMYRYREPRTFRTVHMDVGHVAGTIALAASGLRARCFVAYTDDDQGVEQLLGIDGLDEGYMLTAALG